MCIFFVSYVLYLRKCYSETFVKMVESHSLVTQNYDYLKNNTLTGMSVKYSYFNYDPEMTDARDNNKRLLPFLLSGEKAILYFPENMCNRCFDLHIKKFLDLSKSCDHSNFAIIVPVQIVRRTLAELKDFERIRVFQIPLPIEELKQITLPCMFTIDCQLNVRDFFIPVQNDLSLTEKYIDVLCERYD